MDRTPSGSCQAQKIGSGIELEMAIFGLLVAVDSEVDLSVVRVACFCSCEDLSAPVVRSVQLFTNVG
jgi:hypothetical protein